MKILIFNRIPFAKVRYDLAIDHQKHDVIYLGTAESLSLIPAELRCGRATKAEGLDLFEFVCSNFKNEGLDSLIALSEYDLLPAAAIRTALGLSGPTYDEVLRVRDKLLMKKCVAASGLTVPRNRRLDLHLLEPIGGDRNGKIVLKPIDGALSENVRIYPSVSELDRALRLRRTGVAALDEGGDAAKFYEVEEYIEGPILHLDGWVLDREIQHFVPSGYLGTCLDYAEGKPMGSCQFEDSGDRFRGWAQKAVSAVGIANGAFHLECILSPDGPVFLEIAHRVGGAGVASTFEMKTGVNLYHAHLWAQLGLTERTKGLRRQDASEYFGWFVFPGHMLSGEHLKISGLEEFRDRPEVLVWREQSEGEPLKGSRAHISYQPGDTPLSGQISAPSNAGLVGFMDDLFKSVKIDVAADRACALDQKTGHSDRISVWMS